MKENMEKKRPSGGRKNAGEKELQKADRLLRKLMNASDVQSTRADLSQARRLIKSYQRTMKRKFYVVCMLLGLMTLLAAIWMILYFHGRSQKVTSGQAGTVQADQNSEEVEMLQETVEEEIQPTELLLSFTGDFILGTDEFFVWDTGFNCYYEMYGGEYFLQNVRDIFEKDDLTIINMEGTLTEETARLDKQFAFKGDPEFVDVLTTSSVEAANIANNHSHDYGEQSYVDTVNLLEENNIPVFGYDRLKILEVKGVKIGFFGIYELDDHLERIPQVKSSIAQLKADGADLIVAVFHWGNELETVPDSNQMTLGHLAIDEGADLVVGHHPHVLQGIETYKGKTIAYSLGNFCFGGNTHPTEMDTMIFQQKFQINSKKEIEGSSIETIPCSVSSDASFNNYQPTVLTGTEADRVLELIRERSDAIPSTDTTAEV